MTIREEWNRWLAAARFGDGRSLGQLVEQAAGDLFSVAVGVIHRAARRYTPPEEIYADSLAAVVSEIRSLRATTYLGFRTWFAAIARNKVRRNLRASRVCEKSGADEAELPVRYVEVSPEGLAFLRLGMTRLAESQRLAFTLRHGLGLTWHTIGFLIEQRDPPAARLVHYRAAVRLKDLANVYQELRGLAAG
jgi:DNA-directed RNA polymerase specialized sigma24 family protein